MILFIKLKYVGITIDKFVVGCSARVVLRQAQDSSLHTHSDHNVIHDGHFLNGAVVDRRAPARARLDQLVEVCVLDPVLTFIFSAAFSAPI